MQIFNAAMLIVIVHAQCHYAECLHTKGRGAQWLRLRWS
jgi:hypothetical protein